MAKELPKRPTDCWSIEALADDALANAMLHCEVTPEQVCPDSNPTAFRSVRKFAEEAIRFRENDGPKPKGDQVVEKICARVRAISRMTHCSAENLVRLLDAQSPLPQPTSERATELYTDTLKLVAAIEPQSNEYKEWRKVTTYLKKINKDRVYYERQLKLKIDESADKFEKLPPDIVDAHMAHAFDTAASRWQAITIRYEQWRDGLRK